MSADANKDLIRRFAETVWNGKNTDALDDFHAAAFTQPDHDHAGVEAAVTDAPG